MTKHHRKDGTFRNTSSLKSTHSSIWKVIKWRQQAPKVDPITFPTADTLNSSVYQEASESLTWIGHATFLVKFKGLNFITDPHFSKRASPLQTVGPKRYTEPALSIEELPHIDVVVLSHDHYDHLDLNSVCAIHKNQKANPPLFLVPLKLGKWLTKRGIRNWVELDWWQSTSFGDWKFHAVPVQHFSGRGLKPNNTLWAGWVLEHKPNDTESYKIFFAGDTGYSKDFKDIHERFGPMDLSLIPIGAYEPRWFMKEVHVNPDEAAKIHVDLKSKLSVGMHWGSFILTDEAMDEPPKKLSEAKQKYAIPEQDFLVLEHGECIQVGNIAD